MKESITGIILAGGKSSRMGQDKAFILFSGRPLIEVVIENLSSLFKNLLIISNNQSLYAKYEIEVQPDILEGKGPLGGIHAGLHFSKTKYAFVTACDMPYLNPELVRFLSNETGDYDVIIPEFRQRLEPLCAIYSSNCIEPIEKHLSSGNLKITDFISQVNTCVINEKDVRSFDPEGLSFVNINTPEDI